MTIGQLLLPAAVLVLWTLVMVGWMVATRFPALTKAGIDLRKAAPGGRGQDLDRVLPPQTNWVAHNLVHLHEQPTIFYATIAILALVHEVTALTVGLAWGYTSIRIVHSVWQATVNRIPIRFLLFLASTFCLLGLAMLALIATVSG